MRKRVLFALIFLFAGFLCVVVFNKAAKTTKPVDDSKDTKEDITLPVVNSLTLANGDNDSERFIYEGEQFSSKQSMEEAKKQDSIDLHGADAKLTFSVTDANGRRVPDATVAAFFSIFEKTTKKTGNTDGSGLFVTEGKTANRLNYSVKKDGYYDTQATHVFSQRNGFDVVKGKWIPWNPTVKVILKEKRNPIPMYVQRVTIVLPKKDEAFGYDFEKGDWVPPHGKGGQSDLFFMCSFEERGALLDYKSELVITAAQKGEGMIVNNTDTESQFLSRHEAQENGYEPQVYFVTDRTPSKILQNIELEKTEYLTFRSRILRDDNGNIISSNYGKIYGISYGRVDATSGKVSITLLYYFNPIPNDRNIEYDPNENLFDKMKHRGMKP